MCLPLTSCTFEGFESLILYDEYEVSEYVEWVFSNSGSSFPYNDDPSWTLGLTSPSAYKHQFHDVIVEKGTDGVDPSLTYCFDQNVQLDHMILLSKKGMTDITVKIADKDDKEIGNCVKSVGNDEFSLASNEIEEIFCSKKLGRKVIISTT